MFCSKKIKLDVKEFNKFEIARKIGAIKAEAEKLKLDFTYDRWPDANKVLCVQVTGDEYIVNGYKNFIKKYFVILD